MEDLCDACGYDARTWDTATVADLIEVRAARITALLEGAGDAARRRPSADVWSPAEYAGHVGDALRYHRYLLNRGRAEDRPRLDVPDPDATEVVAAYADLDAGAGAALAREQAARTAALVRDLPVADLGRRIDQGDRVLDLALVMRSAGHEIHHHAGDIAAGLGSPGPAAAPP